MSRDKRMVKLEEFFTDDEVFTKIFNKLKYSKHFRKGYKKILEDDPTKSYIDYVTGLWDWDQFDQITDYFGVQCTECLAMSLSDMPDRINHADYLDYYQIPGRKQIFYYVVNDLGRNAMKTKPQSEKNLKYLTEMEQQTYKHLESISNAYEELTRILRMIQYHKRQRRCDEHAQLEILRNKYAHIIQLISKLNEDWQVNHTVQVMSAETLRGEVPHNYAVSKDRPAEIKYLKEIRKIVKTNIKNMDNRKWQLEEKLEHIEYYLTNKHIHLGSEYTTIRYIYAIINMCIGEMQECGGTNDFLDVASRETIYPRSKNYWDKFL